MACFFYNEGKGSDTMKSRTEIQQALKTFLQAQSPVVAAWEGGSAATGYVDEYSDLDVSIVVEDEAVEAVLQATMHYLESTYGILHSHRVPEPTWHGHSQIFVQVKQTAPLFYFDFVFIKQSHPNKLMESDRHGQAYVYFEKKPIYDSSVTPLDTMMSRAKHFYGLAASTDFLLRIEIKKQIKRDNFLEAFPLLMGFLNRNFGILCNLKYRPAKVDFGVRYAYREYGIEDRNLIEQGMKVSSIAGIKRLFPKIEKRFEALKEEISKTYQ